MSLSLFWALLAHSLPKLSLLSLVQKRSVICFKGFDIPPAVKRSGGGNLEVTVEKLMEGYESLNELPCNSASYQGIPERDEEWAEFSVLPMKIIYGLTCCRRSYLFSRRSPEVRGRAKPTRSLKRFFLSAPNQRPH